MAAQDIVSDLTPAQRAAVEHRDGPLLVVAGAGSGKTRVITRRVANLIAHGVEADRILAITFTNKAAGEMRERIGRLVPGEGRRVKKPTVSTFHSFAARLLRGYGPAVGIERTFTILDEGDRLAATREAMHEAEVDPKALAPGKVIALIGRAKDHVKTPQDLANEATTVHERQIARIYERYEALLRSRSALDFDDLLSLSVKLLRDDPVVREKLASRFRYLLIDEYQDTNHAQYELAKLLAQGHRNVCATGDPDQSIYGWRGADVENILRFTRDWPDAKVVTLERNYRSTKVICRAANALIRHNKLRVPKDLVTENDEGAPIELFEAPDEHQEAHGVARRIEEAIAAGTKPGEIAVFYRANSLSRGMEQALFERGIPYVVIGALEFYERKEVKDLLAYLRVLTNPRDDESVKRVLSVPPRGIGKTTLDKLRAHAKAESVSLLEALEHVELPKKARSGADELLATLDKLRARLADGAEAVVRAVVEETNYVAYLKEYDPENDDRAENVDALIGAASEFDRRSAEEAFQRAAAAPPPPPPPVPEVEEEEDDEGGLPLFAGTKKPARTKAVEAPAPSEDDPWTAVPTGVHGFLEQVALISEVKDQQQAEAEREKVSLMTVHTAKGLEFELVFLTGVEDGLFPNSRALEESVTGLEEERRLAYVAITRARKRLVISHAEWRSRFGRSDTCRPSPFIFELPDDVLENGRAPRERVQDDADFGDDVFGGAPKWKSKAPQKDWEGVDPPGADDDEDAPRRVRKPTTPSRSLWARPLSTEDAVARAAAAKAVDPGPFKQGDRVSHELFGVGRVLEVSGAGAAQRVKVHFVTHGEKNLVLQYARLTKVER